MRRFLAMLAVVMAAGVAWGAPSIRDSRPGADNHQYRVNFDDTTADSPPMEVFGLCSIRFTLGSGDSGTATVYECDSANDATGSCTSETSFTSSTATPYTFTPGQRWLKVAASASTLDDSEMTIDCTRNQLSESGSTESGTTDDMYALSNPQPGDLFQVNDDDGTADCAASSDGGTDDVLCMRTDGGSWVAAGVAGGTDNLGNHTATQDVDMQSNDLLNVRSMRLEEKASADASVSGEGEVWASSTDSRLYWTDDNGIDWPVNPPIVDRWVVIEDGATFCSKWAAALQPYMEGTADSHDTIGFLFDVDVTFAQLHPMNSTSDAMVCGMYYPQASGGFSGGFPDANGATNNNAALVNHDPETSVHLFMFGEIRIDNSAQTEDVAFFDFGNRFNAGYDDNGGYGFLNGQLSASGNLMIRQTAGVEGAGLATSDLDGAGLHGQNLSEPVSAFSDSVFVGLRADGANYADLHGLTLRFCGLDDDDVGALLGPDSFGLDPPEVDTHGLNSSNCNNEGVGVWVKGAANWDQPMLAKVRQQDYGIQLGDVYEAGRRPFNDNCDALGEASNGSCTEINDQTARGTKWAGVNEGHSQALIADVDGVKEHDFGGMYFECGTTGCARGSVLLKPHVCDPNADGDDATAEERAMPVTDDAQCINSTAQGVNRSPVAGFSSFMFGPSRMPRTIQGAGALAPFFLGPDWDGGHILEFMPGSFVRGDSTSGDVILAATGATGFAYNRGIIPAGEQFGTAANATLKDLGPGKIATLSASAFNWWSMYGESAVTTEAELEAAIAACGVGVGGGSTTKGCEINFCGTIETADGIQVGGATTATAKSGVHLHGCGAGLSNSGDEQLAGATLKWTGAGAGTVLDVDGCKQCSFRGFAIDGEDLATSGLVLDATAWGTTGTIVEDMTIEDIAGYGIDIDPAAGNGQADHLTFRAVTVRRSDGCIRQQSTQSLNNQFENIECVTDGSPEVLIDSGQVAFKRSFFGTASASQTIFDIQEGVQFSIDDNLVELHHTSPIVLDADSGVQGSWNSDSFTGNRILVDTTGSTCVDYNRRGYLDLSENILRAQNDGVDAGCTSTIENTLDSDAVYVRAENVTMANLVAGVYPEHFDPTLGSGAFMGSGFFSSANALPATCADGALGNVEGESVLYVCEGGSWVQKGGGGTDNLGNHTATQDLDLDENAILNIKSLSRISRDDGVSPAQLPVVDWKLWKITGGEKSGSDKTKQMGHRTEFVSLAQGESFGNFTTHWASGDSDAITYMAKLYCTGGAMDTGDEGCKPFKGLVTDYWQSVHGTTQTEITSATGEITIDIAAVNESESKFIGSGNLIVFDDFDANDGAVPEIFELTALSPGVFDLAADAVHDAANWKADGTGTGQGVWTVNEALAEDEHNGRCLIAVGTQYTDGASETAYHPLRIVDTVGDPTNTVTTEWIAQGIDLGVPYEHAAQTGAATAWIVDCAEVVEMVDTNDDYVAEQITINKTDDFTASIGDDFSIYSYGTRKMDGIVIEAWRKLGRHVANSLYKATAHLGSGHSYQHGAGYSVDYSGNIANLRGADFPYLDGYEVTKDSAKFGYVYNYTNRTTNEGAFGLLRPDADAWNTDGDNHIIFQVAATGGPNLMVSPTLGFNVDGDSVALESILASTSNGEGASLIGVEDAAANFTATDVEGVLAELAGLTGGADADAIHDNVDGEIAAVTSKATPVAADLLLIEDSAASNAKKSATISSLETAIEGFLDLPDLQGQLGLSQIADGSWGDVTVTSSQAAVTGIQNGAVAQIDDVADGIRTGAGTGSLLATAVSAGTSGNCAEWDANGNVGDAGSPCGSGGSVAGSDTHIQYNDGGSFGGDAGLTWDDVNHELTIGEVGSPGVQGTVIVHCDPGSHDCEQEMDVDTAFSGNAASGKMLLQARAGGLWIDENGSAERKVLDQSDEGTGNGLDADTLDGEEATAFQDADADLDDLADGSLTGSKVGTGIDAANLTTGSLDLGTGTIRGGVSIETTDGTSPDDITAAEGQWVFADDGVAYELDLPALSSGASVCVYSASAHTITIDPNASEVIVLEGAAESGGEAIDNSGSAAAGDFICLLSNGTNWYTLGSAGTWDGAVD